MASLEEAAVTGTENIEDLKISVVDCVDKFLQDLHEVLTDHLPNIIYSPMSVVAILALLKSGASEDTEKEIQELLQLTTSTVQTNHVFLHMLQPIKEPPWKGNVHIPLQAATRLYRKNGLNLKEDFIRNALENYFVDIAQIDATNPKKTADDMNLWISKMTKTNLEKVVPEDFLNRGVKGMTDTGIILINAINLELFWAHKFVESDTTMEIFRFSDTATKEIAMMKQRRHFYYVHLKEHHVTVLEMEIKSVGKGEFFMLWFLPDESSNLDVVENSVKNLSVEEIRSGMNNNFEVMVHIPKINMHSTIAMKTALQKLGVESMFDPEFADFGNLGTISDNRRIFVSEIIQKVSIDISEDGCGSGVKLPSPSPQQIQFRVDRPFMFQIVEKQSNLILFAGRYTKP